MMPITPVPTSQIYERLSTFFKRFGLPLHCFYAGIAADPRSRMFVDHKVDEGALVNYTWSLAADYAEARAIEAACHQAGCRGTHTGGDQNTRYVYVYLISPTTLE